MDNDPLCQNFTAQFENKLWKNTTIDLEKKALRGEVEYMSIPNLSEFGSIVACSKVKVGYFPIPDESGVPSDS